MECDPHQLIEGCLIACYAAGLSQCFLYIRGEMPLAHERVAQGAQRRLRRRLHRHATSSAPNFSVDIVLHWGAGAYVVGEETALIESLEGERGMPRLKPPYFPAAIGLYGTADDRQQRRDAVEPAVHRAATARPPTRRSARETSPGTRMIAVSGHVKRPGCLRDRQRLDHVPRPALRRRVLRRASATATSSRRSCPAAGRHRGSPPDQLDIPFEGRAAGAAGSMLGSGAVMVMDSTTDIPAAALTLVRFYAHESCGKCVPCREGGTWLYRIVAAHRRRRRHRRRPRHDPSRSASRSARATCRTRRASGSASTPCRSRTR